MVPIKKIGIEKPLDNLTLKLVTKGGEVKKCVEHTL